MKKFFFYFSLSGFAGGSTAHILSVAGVDVKDHFSLVWLLHIGIFVAWGAAMFELLKKEEFKALNRSGGMELLNPKVLFNICFKESPRWLNIAVLCCFIYAVVNFALFMISGPGNAEIRNGQYTLENNGNVIAILTESRYHYYRAWQLRGFSGHWMAFYAAAMAILYPVAFKTTTSEYIKAASPN